MIISVLHGIWDYKLVSPMLYSNEFLFLFHHYYIYIYIYIVKKEVQRFYYNV